jgi:NAD(P) transhydrogenase subunit alpha
MNFSVPAETLAGQSRAAAAPETVKKLNSPGHPTVLVQASAGAGASIPSVHCVAAGAAIVLNSAVIHWKGISCLRS